MLIYWSVLFWGAVHSVQKCLFIPNVCLFSAAFVQSELCVTTLIQRRSRREGREFHKALNSIKLAKFYPSTWLNIILEMLWWHPQKIQLYFQMTAFSDLLTVNNISFMKIFL